jgi:hypothetical protein
VEILLMSFRVAARTVPFRRLQAAMVALLLAVPLVAVVSLAAAAPATAATPVVPSLRVPAGLPATIEPLTDYVGQTSCRPGYLPGTAVLGRLLTATYRNTSVGGAYACGTDGSRSEHYDGRAIDWMNSVRNPVQAAQAASVIKFLLATDPTGNKFAMARRLGVMYVIWNNQMWGAWSGRWEPYNNCAKTPSPALDSSCHRNHMHISLSFNGAFGRTSFFSHRTFSATDYGPCRASDLNWSAAWSAYNPRGCPSYPTAGIPPHSSQAMVALVTYSGATMYPGMSGGPIQAVQQAFKMPVTGRYDWATMVRVRWFRVAHHLSASWTIDAATWRQLLAAYQPR